MGPLSPSNALRDESPEDLLRTAEELEIPWRRILQEEIQAEEALRRHGAASPDAPLSTSLAILSSSFLKSWRVRCAIHELSREARGASFRGAVRELRLVFRRLTGVPNRGDPALSGHLRQAYERVLLLHRVCLAARRSRGTDSERMAFICSSTRCAFDDAAWALCRQGAPRPGHRLDAAIQKARDEGFDIPRAATEAQAFARLRRIVGASPRLVVPKP